MNAQLATLEEDKKQYQEQLEIVQAQLKDDPDNAELASLHEELNNMITLLSESMAELKPKQPTVPAVTKAPTPPPAPEKWSRENHPAFKKPPPQDEKEADSAPVSYKVNDEVMAKWLSGDKSFYPARITSITGSSTAPIYIVTFKGYGTTETIRARDIRPMQKAQKRKADTPAAPSLASTVAPPPPSPDLPEPSNNGVVLSAAASLYPEKVLEAKRAEQKEDDQPPAKRKKIKAKKELEAGKSKWQEFNSKSKFGKTHKKDSMFRTPEGINGRVGFTGSGQAMRKDPSRSRHVYQMNEEMD